NSALSIMSVECVPGIRACLARATAEEWAEASAGFSAQVREESLPLAAGIAIVHEWLWVVRRLLRVIGATEHLPYSLGKHPTPRTHTLSPLTAQSPWLMKRRKASSG